MPKVVSRFCPSVSTYFNKAAPDELNKRDSGHRRFIVCTNNENGICENVTYPRVKTVITGKRADGSDYAEGIAANVKYYRTTFVSKDEEYLSDALLEHIAKMIQLEYFQTRSGRQGR